MISTQVPARGQTNVKVIEKSSPTAPEKMHHVNITSETLRLQRLNLV
jgi:hypothetical protein